MNTSLGYSGAQATTIPPSPQALAALNQTNTPANPPSLSVSQANAGTVANTAQTSNQTSNTNQGSQVIGQFLAQRNVLDAQKIAKNKQQLAITQTKEQERQEALQEREQQEGIKNITDVARATETVAGGLNSNLTEIQVTRGLGVAFLLLVILLWALVPTKTGYTRLQLLWFTLLGETKLNHNAATNTIQSTLESQTNQTNQSQNPTVQLSGPSEEQVEAASQVHTTMQVLSDAEIAALNSSSF